MEVVTNSAEVNLATNSVEVDLATNSAKVDLATEVVVMATGVAAAVLSQ